MPFSSSSSSSSWLDPDSGLQMNSERDASLPTRLHHENNHHINERRSSTLNPEEATAATVSTFSSWWTAVGLTPAREALDSTAGSEGTTDDRTSPEETEPTSDGETMSAAAYSSSGAGNLFSSSSSSWTQQWRETAGEVAQWVHRSARAVAREWSQWEDETQGLDSMLPLPWDVQVKLQGDTDLQESTTWQEDVALKKKIQLLSQDEATFLEAVVNLDALTETEAPPFSLDEARIFLIQRLLHLDPQLAAAHAKWSGRREMDETTFWRNYFDHCQHVRQEHLRGQKSEAAETSSPSPSRPSSSLPDSSSTRPERGRNVSDASLASEPDDQSFVHVPPGLPEEDRGPAGDLTLPSPPVSTGLLSVDSMVLVLSPQAPTSPTPRGGDDDDESLPSPPR